MASNPQPQIPVLVKTVSLFLHSRHVLPQKFCLSLSLSSLPFLCSALPLSLSPSPLLPPPAHPRMLRSSLPSICILITSHISTSMEFSICRADEGKGKTGGNTTSCPSAPPSPSARTIKGWIALTPMARGIALIPMARGGGG